MIISKGLAWACAREWFRRRWHGASPPWLEQLGIFNCATRGWVITLDGRPAARIDNYMVRIYLPMILSYRVNPMRALAR
jgi:hypothetical protein